MLGALPLSGYIFMHHWPDLKRVRASTPPMSNTFRISLLGCLTSAVFLFGSAFPLCRSDYPQAASIAWISEDGWKKMKGSNMDRFKMVVFVNKKLHWKTFRSTLFFGDLPSWLFSVDFRVFNHLKHQQNWSTRKTRKCRLRPRCWQGQLSSINHYINCYWINYTTNCDTFYSPCWLRFGTFMLNIQFMICVPANLVSFTH